MGDIDANTRFEIVADLFHKATGKMRPGKDQPPGFEDTFEERKVAFALWETQHGYADAITHIATLTRDNKRLRVALEPFALLGEKLIEFGVDDKPIWLIELNGLNYSVRATSLKQAAAAMAKEAPDGS